MKKFWEKHHQLIILIMALILIFLAWIVLYLNGIRFCYNPKLAITWEQSAVIADWIGAMATVAGVIASVVAIFYAIRVPKEIAASQNKIALFEKRFKCYTEISKLLGYAELLKNSNKPIEVIEVFGCADANLQDVKLTSISSVLVMRLNEIQLEVESGEFLFSNYNRELAMAICGKAGELLETIALLDMTALATDLSDELGKVKQEYIKLCEKFKKDYFISMEKDLNLI